MCTEANQPALLAPTQAEIPSNQLNLHSIEILPPNQQNVKRRTVIHPDFGDEIIRNPTIRTPDPELISGILRVGGKMIVAGSSKSGKSCMLQDLGLSIALGKEWMGFKCRQGPVLYINLEIMRKDCNERVYKIMQMRGYDVNDLRGTHNWESWPMRGYNMTLEDLSETIIRRIQAGHHVAYIVDPIYKVIQGDENSASDMARFVAGFDEICDITGAAVIYAHHFAKGSAGGKSVADRASGSGVFARDPDALITLTQLSQLPADYPPKTRGYRIESVLRGFEDIDPISVRFDPPVHVIDHNLDNCPIEGSRDDNLASSSKRKKGAEAADKVMEAFEKLERTRTPRITVKRLEAESGVSQSTIRLCINPGGILHDKLINEGGNVSRREV